MSIGVVLALNELNNNLRSLIKVLNEKLPGPLVEEYSPATRPDVDFPFRKSLSKKNIPPAAPVRGPKP